MRRDRRLRELNAGLRGRVTQQEQMTTLVTRHPEKASDERWRDRFRGRKRKERIKRARWPVLASHKEAFAEVCQTREREDRLWSVIYCRSEWCGRGMRAAGRLARSVVAGW